LRREGRQRNTTGNLPLLPGISPDYMAPVVRNAPDGVRELAMLGWGMPSSQFAQMQATKKRAAKLEAKGQVVDFKQLLRTEPDGGTTNIRNVASKHGIKIKPMKEIRRSYGLDAHSGNNHGAR
jgi:putative SOS response-associated peptidase YedK